LKSVQRNSLSYRLGDRKKFTGSVCCWALVLGFLLFLGHAPAKPIDLHSMQVDVSCWASAPTKRIPIASHAAPTRVGTWKRPPECNVALQAAASFTVFFAATFR